MCNPEKEMPESQSVAQSGPGAGLLVLGVDTCGPSGTVALARIERGMPPYLRKDGTHEDENATILGQKELAGRTYSATLVAAVSDLLTEKAVKLANLGAIVVVNGPGSFTGVRVGLSAVKGLAEPGQIPVVAVSRLAVLAAKTRVDSAALDAHRHEVFLRLMEADGCSRELLAGAEELTAVELRPVRVAVCDDVAPALLESVWKGAEFVRSEAPTAADAIQLCMPRILAGDFADLASSRRTLSAKVGCRDLWRGYQSSGEIERGNQRAADDGCGPGEGDGDGCLHGSCAVVVAAGL